jgi:hypothetical protein
MMKSRTLGVSIDRPPAQVAAFIRNPENLSRWLTFASAVRKSGEAWFLETAEGPLEIRFVPDNPYGVVDNRVRLPEGREVVNPMRVVANGAGSEVLFTLFRQPGWSDERFAQDAAVVRADLGMLKRVLEALGSESVSE